MRAFTILNNSPKSPEIPYMSYLGRLFNWKFCLILSLLILATLMVLNFYGLYTNRFYFFKVDNYIFPLLASVHLIYLYVIWFKIRERDYADPQMRNLEFIMYAILLVYLFKASDTTYMLMNASRYEDYILPETFMPMGITILSLQVVLVVLTLFAFSLRKKEIGAYNFDNINENIDSWQ